MALEIGPQYPQDAQADKSGFLARARLHQSKYLTEVLKVQCDEYGNFLRKEDAERGLNFYSDFDIFNAVTSRYPNYNKQLRANMLRSEHIPFNFFVPLLNDLSFATAVFNELLPFLIKSIDEIRVEWAPKPVQEYLNDGTSFDTYIECIAENGGKCGIGIEVKYTERDYKLDLGSREERAIQDRGSLYYEVSEASNLYQSGYEESLPTDLFRQVWRNQLLGESMLLHKDSHLQDFISMTFYPSANEHFKKVEEDYPNFLAEDKKYKFRCITYEKFFDVLRQNSPDSNFGSWIDYLDERYIVQ